MTLNCQWLVVLASFAIFTLFLCIRPLVLNDVTTQLRGHGTADVLGQPSPRQFRAPIKCASNLYFVTEFSVGTPAQVFRGLIQHTPADFALPSLSCQTKACSGHLKYNANQSFTTAGSDRGVSLEYGSVTTSGRVTSDTFRIAGLEIINQPFVQADQRTEAIPSWGDHEFDAIISLSPTDETTQARLDTPFMSVIDRHLLDVNRFSIKPPSGKLDEPGELTFGTTDDHKRLGHRLVRIPVKGTDSRERIAPWQVEARAVHTAGQSTFLTNHIAVFDAGNPFMTFPHQAIAPLFRALKPIDYLGYTLAAVDCDRRDGLPDLTVDLGGHNFTITASEYTYERVFGDGSLRCLLAIDYTEKNWFLLGSSFLKRFYSVFDWDAKEVGLIPLDQFYEE